MTRLETISYRAHRQADRHRSSRGQELQWAMPGAFRSHPCVRSFRFLRLMSFCRLLNTPPPQPSRHDAAGTMPGPAAQGRPGASAWRPQPRVLRSLCGVEGSGSGGDHLNGTRSASKGSCRWASAKVLHDKPNGELRRAFKNEAGETTSGRAVRAEWGAARWADRRGWLRLGFDRSEVLQHREAKMLSQWACRLHDRSPGALLEQARVKDLG